MKSEALKAVLLMVAVVWISFEGLHAQGSDELRFADMDSVHVNSENTLLGNALWGHLNGGADLYLEYGFSSLLVQEIEWKGSLLKAEIFKMNGEEHAYGIFSVLAGDQIKTDAKGYYSSNPWQYQAALGKYYVSVVNATGSSKDAIAVLQAGNWLGKELNVKPLELPELPSAGKSFGPILHARGKLGMRNACQDINPLFRELEGYTLWIRVDRKSRNIVGRLIAPVGLMNYIQVKARVMDTPLGDVFVTEFNRLNDDTALFKCQYRDRTKDTE